MKIKTIDKEYDGDNEIVMVVLTEQDKRNIANMHADCTKYCQYPASANLTDEFVDTFMEINNGVVI